MESKYIFLKTAFEEYKKKKTLFKKQKHDRNGPETEKIYFFPSGRCRHMFKRDSKPQKHPLNFKTYWNLKKESIKHSWNSTGNWLNTLETNILAISLEMASSQLL